MKLLSYLAICVLLVGCSSLAKEEQADNQKAAPSAPTELPKKYLGFWVSEAYYAALQQTKSTKRAGEMGVDDFYKIWGRNSIMRLNIHEGGAENSILMVSDTKGQIFSADSAEAYDHIAFSDGQLIINNTKYIQAPNHDRGLNELVNQAFISGRYAIDGEPVEFSNTGKVIGLDSIQSYELHLDYNDAGMQYDKIYLQVNQEKEARTYLYEFAADTLIIFEIDCKTQAEDYDYCLEVEKGVRRYTLVKVRKK